MDVMAPFEITWSEWQPRTEEERFYWLKSDTLDRESLHIETAPMPHPNSAGSTIIGKVIWQRTSEC